MVENRLQDEFARGTFVGIKASGPIVWTQGQGVVTAEKEVEVTITIGVEKRAAKAIAETCRKPTVMMEPWLWKASFEDDAVLATGSWKAAVLGTALIGGAIWMTIAIT